MKILFCGIVCSLLTFSEGTIPHNRILGGKETTIEKHPYQISFQVGGVGICGGFLLNESYVVTAAHCLLYATMINTSIRLGTSTLDKGGIVQRITKFHVHPKFNILENNYNVAMVRLEKPVVFTEKIQPIEIGEVPSAGSKVLLSGWGGDGLPNLHSENLKEVEIPIVSEDTCKKAFAGTGQDTLLCAGGDGQGGCWGDDGSPLVYNKKVIGVYNWGKVCGSLETPGRFTDLEKVKSWILDVLHKE